MKSLSLHKILISASLIGMLALPSPALAFSFSSLWTVPVNFAESLLPAWIHHSGGSSSKATEQSNAAKSGGKKASAKSAKSKKGAAKSKKSAKAKSSKKAAKKSAKSSK